MEKDYRIIQVIDSVDNITGNQIEIFELFPIVYEKTGYIFIPTPSVNNHFFIFERSENMYSYFTNNPEEIKKINISDFEQKIITTPEGDRTTFFSKILSEKRRIFS